MNIKIKSLSLLFISLVIAFPVFSIPLSLKRQNIILKYKYSNSFEKGTETVYCFKNKYCVRRYTEKIEESKKALSETSLFPLFFDKNVNSAYRLIADEKYIYEINDLKKTVTQVEKIRIPEVSKIKDKKNKELYANQNKPVTEEEIEKMLFKNNPVLSTAFQNVKKAPKIVYFGKPCKTYTIMGAKFIYWEDILLFREIPFEDNTKDVLEIESIDLNAKLDLSVFEIPSYYKTKKISQKEFMSLIAEKDMTDNKILSEIEKIKAGFKS